MEISFLLAVSPTSNTRDDWAGHGIAVTSVNNNNNRVRTPFGSFNILEEGEVTLRILRSTGAFQAEEQVQTFVE